MSAAAVAAIALAASKDDNESTSSRDALERLGAPQRDLITAPGLPRTAEQMVVTARGLTAKASPESHCLSSRRGAYCVDSIPLTDASPVLPVASNELVGARLGAAALRVAARLARLEDGIPRTPLSKPLAVRRLDRGSRWWAVRMPASVPPEGAALSIRVTYRDYRGSPHGEPVPFDLKVRGP